MSVPVEVYSFPDINNRDFVLPNPIHDGARVEADIGGFAGEGPDGGRRHYPLPSGSSAGTSRLCQPTRSYRRFCAIRRTFVSGSGCQPGTDSCG